MRLSSSMMAVLMELPTSPNSCRKPSPVELSSSSALASWGWERHMFMDSNSSPVTSSLSWTPTSATTPSLSLR
ncbi:hypothetical protein DH86_00003611 [Scytalidium sp. 3C]|nr:hypothetical protein DH86_00003611 [Scytalidium sp. 3C]